MNIFARMHSILLRAISTRAERPMENINRLYMTQCSYPLILKKWRRVTEEERLLPAMKSNMADDDDDDDDVGLSPPTADGLLAITGFW